MAKKKYEEANIEAIADTIREKTGSEKTYKTKDMAEGVSEVFEAGKRAEYDAFWDSYQHNGVGSLSTYGSAFFGNGWNDKTFNPKYDIICEENESATKMFYRSSISNIHQVLVDRGLKIVIGANATNLQEMFSLCDTKEVPPIETGHCTYFGYMFNSDGRNTLETIHKLNMTSATNANAMFNKQGALKNITFEGEIPISLNFQHSPLAPASLKSIIKHLKNYVNTSNEFAYTLTVKASAWQALESEGFTDEDYRHILSVFPDTNPTIVDSWDTFVVAWLRWNLVLA